MLPSSEWTMGLKSGLVGVTWIKLGCGLLEAWCFSPYRCYNVQTRTAGRRRSDLWFLWAESCCRCPSPAPRHHRTHWKLLCHTATGWPAPGEKTHSYYCVVFLLPPVKLRQRGAYCQHVCLKTTKTKWRNVPLTANGAESERPRPRGSLLFHCSVKEYCLGFSDT